jgi:macrolide-specific efflux system membrane fusion protein
MALHVHRAALLTSAASVEVVSVERGNVEKSVTSAGKIMSNLDVDIKCRAGGPVAKLPVDISQSVKTGDLLCQLDPTDEQLAVRVAERTLAESTAKVEQARLTYEQAALNLETTRARDQSALESATQSGPAETAGRAEAGKRRGLRDRPDRCRRRPRRRR